MSGEKMASVEPPEAESKDALEPANSDPASSLRAAALRTLKSKRRKPTDAQSTASLLSRPMAIDNSFQLDYGQEDDITSSPPQAPADRETGQTREEGEISDSEGPDSVAAKPTSSRTSLPQHTQTATSVDDNSISTRSSPPRTLKMESPPPTLLDRISDTSARPRRSSASTMTDEGNLSQRSFFIDAEHVRPGLQINQEQYDAAKDIVLDLLGWGVPPEYLVDCGLSREIVYYVFTELNLRFPNNLDITGLVPYNPVTAKSLLRDLNAPPRASVPRSMGHPSLPPKPVSASQARPPTPPAIESSQLNDMERQRRQELLARKAVISSRKEKTSASTSPSTNPTATDDQDVEMTPLIPTETVDDFLKSIGSVSDGDKTCEDRMEVDDIPGLTGPSSHSSSLMSTPALPLDTQLIPMDDHSPSAIDPSDSGNPKSRRSSASSEDQNHANGRKATKRPVAADFVDFEGSPRGRHSANSSGTVHPHLKRKLGGSFASVSAMRRCVIDLSDSEGEDDRGDTRPGLPPVVRRMSVPVSSVRSTTPPDTPQSAGAALSRSKSPNALAEKEAEILKMKQLIAERQHLNKLKRMESGGANTPGIVTPLTEEIAGTDLLPTVTDLSSNEKLLSESNVQGSTSHPLQTGKKKIIGSYAFAQTSTC
ncbi:hypothetical protein K435DRAFT_431464 [Dendrothele bispora CBS 962.96]|uniref:Uncharacterized protein n=1 Tax=Dendrothele bispora (strain CBS 962.96) TaxID=1314807 RepID=A0A4S8ME31_DENBC|nr:hypothetical protein K435DRAFT_431464 [Dendrothele bispora CBS 962.96]